MNKFFIVRHGQTVWNIEGRTQGNGDSNLTDKGIEQTTLLAKKLLYYNIDYIYSSPLGRTIQTCDIISKILKKDVVYEEGLKEINFGKWEGLTIEDIKSSYLDIYKVWRNEPHKAQIPDGETLSIVKDRVVKTIDKLNNNYSNKNILLVSHGMTIKVMLLSLLGSDLSNLYRIRQDNTALNIVEFRDYGPVIITMNDTNHIKGDK